jgi:hypothetical protein
MARFADDDCVVLNEMLLGGPSVAVVLGSVVAHCGIINQSVCMTVNATKKKRLESKPARVEFYVDRVIPQYSDPTFKSHFRMTRATFEVHKSGPLRR